MEKASVRRKDQWECGAVELQNKDLLNFPSPCRSLCCTEPPLFVLLLDSPKCCCSYCHVPSLGCRQEGSQQLLLKERTHGGCWWVIHLLPWGQQRGGNLPEMVQMGYCGEAEPETTPLVSRHKIGTWEMEMREKRSIMRQMETTDSACLSWTVP